MTNLRKLAIKPGPSSLGSCAFFGTPCRCSYPLHFLLNSLDLKDFRHISPILNERADNQNFMFIQSAWTRDKELLYTFPPPMNRTELALTRL